MSTRRKLTLSLTLGSILALAFVSVALATHPRPGGGSPIRVPLVPTFAECIAPNTVHIAPIALPSCTPPVLEGDILTLGTLGAGQGFTKLTVFCVAPETTAPCTPNDGQEEQDIAVQSTGSDIRCQKVTIGCSAVGADYTGRIIGQSNIRITDHSNPLLCTNSTGATPCTTATVEDTTFAVPTPPGACVAVNGASPPGATCTLNTTINAQVPGAVKEFQRGNVSVFGLEITDVGEDGNPGTACPPVCGTGDETRFATQGLFIP